MLVLSRLSWFSFFHLLRLHAFGAPPSLPASSGDNLSLTSSDVGNAASPRLCAVLARAPHTPGSRRRLLRPPAFGVTDSPPPQSRTPCRTRTPCSPPPTSSLGFSPALQPSVLRLLLQLLDELPCFCGRPMVCNRQRL
ncbi:uncharacterized protein A4U43_C05F13440 [Asparagus officinalis]|uniref:Secreted protein n=1 Tax=Asparagus officinalis TaxID=4686 RepID=A0A5P1EV33_ASPOF|nr:uncharacterized protein A4U43_C05F13440 [Asparagus officinalis]